MSNNFYYEEKKIDTDIFIGDKNKNIVKYNLPAKVEFCKKCLNSNQRPTTRAEHLIKEDITIPTRFFDGVCEACVIKDKKQSQNISWN